MKTQARLLAPLSRRSSTAPAADNNGHQPLAGRHHIIYTVLFHHITENLDFN